MKTEINPILHGEAMIFESDIPENAKKLEITDKHLVIADSETTGNHHVVSNSEGCTFYELDGIRYMRNESPTTVKCVHENRHDTLEIPTGTWRFDSQQEYDYFTESLRAVRD
jgi:hypothetical protein